MQAKLLMDPKLVETVLALFSSTQDDQEYASNTKLYS